LQQDTSRPVCLSSFNPRRCRDVAIAAKCISAKTPSECGGIFSNYFSANSPKIVPVKKKLQSWSLISGEVMISRWCCAFVHCRARCTINP